MTAPPAPPARSQPVGGSNVAELSDADLDAVWGRLRDIRAEVQNLRKDIDKIESKLQLEDSNTRAAEVAAVISAAAGRFTTNSAQIDDRVVSLRDLCEQRPAIYGYAGDTVANVENLWERCRDTWPTLGGSLDDVAVAVPAIKEAMREIVYQCGMLTIPPRVNEHLEHLRIGNTLDFDESFEDEVGSADDRRRLLDYMARQPAAIDGLVDVEAGVIYAVPRVTGFRLYRPFILPILLVGLGAIGVWLADRQFGSLGAEDSLTAYGLVIAGAIAHFLVDFLKAARTGGSMSLGGVDDWILWLRVREAAVAVSILTLWLGVAGLLVYTSGPVEPGVAFAVGYGVDSVADIFIQRLGGAAEARLSSFASQLTRVTE